METKSKASRRSRRGVPVSNCEDDQHCELVSCEICQKEIPSSALQSAEAEAYARRYCGDACVDKMKTTTPRQE